MKLISHSFRDGGVIPGRCAFGVQAPKGHVRLADNRNPHLAWIDAPAATKSFVLICTDPDAPTKADDVNKEDREVPATLKRGDFIHWVMVDIPPSVSRIAEGEASQGVTPKGKKKPAGPEGSRQGVNDYTGWFKGDKAMTGTYLGYDGPCPPWNDSLAHHYRVELFATDLEQCPVEGAFTAADVHKAIDGHVLARASITGRYALNPRLQPVSTPLNSMRRRRS
jgi:Raf kinase inhibitor-like YbhB/YbcL family protein